MSHLIPGEYDVMLNGVQLHYTVRVSGPAAGDAYLLPDYAADVQALRLHLGLDKPIVMGWSPCNSRPPILIDYPKLIFFDTSADFGDIR